MICPNCNNENPADTNFCGKCGTQFTPSDKVPISQTETLRESLSALSRGRVFANRFEVIEELGRGGMGKVYRVLDRKIDDEIALKLLKPEIALDEKTITRFKNELKVARKITHKNVCRMYDLNEEERTQYITMEYVRGEDLKNLIRRIGHFTPGKAIFIARQVCEGLAEAHKLGIVHRDLKPQNIMIDREGNAHIMDFGIARSLRAEGITDSGVIIGTPHYMAPEQVEGKEVDQRSDIYALGVILFEMLTGVVPFDGDTPLVIAVKHKTEPPPDPRKLNPQLSEEVSRVILKCMEKGKNKRYQTAEELLNELSKLKKDLPTTDRFLPELKFEMESPRKHIVPKILIFAAILIIGGYFFYNKVLQKEKREKPTAPAGQITQKAPSLINQSGRIEINSMPEGAEVYISDKLEGSTPFKKELTPGTYGIRIKKSPEYKEITDVLNIKVGETYSKNYTLAAMTQSGILEVNSTPPEAEIYLNDKREGLTPFKRELPPGSYNIRIRKSPDYREITDVLNIKVGETYSKHYTLATMTQSGSLEVNSSPAGAEVYLNNRPEGLTPFKRELPPGTYKIRVKKSPGYKEITDVLSVKADKTISKSYTLNLAYVLNLKTDPDGADVSIDGNYMGKTPIEIELPKNTCQLMLKRGEGWSSIDEALTLEPGLNYLYRSLKMMTYSLSVNTTPPGARVFIGEASIGISPLKIPNLSGTYNIRIEKEGYETIKETIAIKSDGERVYDLIKSKLELVKIRFKASPYADLYIDGMLIGEIPPIRIQEVEEGKHTIEFASSALNKRYKVEVEVKKGESIEIRMNMETGEYKTEKINLKP